jgi:hypothetical protein
MNNYLYPADATPVLKFMMPDVSYPGTYYWEYNYAYLGNPSPYTGKVIILFNEESLLIIKMYNVLGEQVLTETLHSAQGGNSIDISNQPNGIYLYRVLEQDGSLIGEGKLIIQK